MDDETVEEIVALKKQVGILQHLVGKGCRWNEGLHDYIRSDKDFTRAMGWEEEDE